MKFINKNLFKNLDIKLSYLIFTICSFFSIYLIIKSINPSLPLFISFFSGFYIISNRKINIDIQLSKKLKNEHRILNDLLFVWSLITVIWIIYSINYPYNYLLYIALSVMAISVVISVIFSKKNWITLFKIVILITLIRASIFYAFPNNFGLDIIFHSRLAQETINSGHIILSNEFINYSYYPIYHIILAIMNYFSNVRINDLVFILGTFELIILNLVIYSIGKKLDNEKLAIISCFIFSILAPVISEYAIPNFYGLILFSILFLIILKEKNYLFSIIFIICSISLIYTHPYPPVNIIFVMIALYLTLLFIKYLKIEDIESSKSFLKIETIFLTIVMFLGYCILWGENPIIRKYMLYSFSSEKAVTSVVTNPSFSILNVYNDLYYYLAFGLSILGIFFFLNIRQKLTFKKIFIAILSFIMVFSFFAIGVIQLSFIPIPYRILPFLLIVLSFSIAYGVIYIYKFTGGKKISQIFTIFILATFFCLSMTSANLYPDLPLYSGEISYRTSMNTTEIYGLNFVNTYTNEKLTTDSYSLNYMKYAGHSDFYNRSSSKKFKIVILREYFLNNPYLRESSHFPDQNGTITLDEYQQIQKITNWDRIYENGNTWVFFNN